MSDATVMLAAVNAGDSKAAEELLVLVYDKLLDFLPRLAAEQNSKRIKLTGIAQAQQS